jgi:hypothetical protein
VDAQSDVKIWIDNGSVQWDGGTGRVGGSEREDLTERAVWEGEWDGSALWRDSCDAHHDLNMCFRLATVHVTLLVEY